MPLASVLILSLVLVAPFVLIGVLVRMHGRLRRSEEDLRALTWRLDRLEREAAARPAPASGPEVAPMLSPSPAPPAREMEDGLGAGVTDMIPEAAPVVSESVPALASAVAGAPSTAPSPAPPQGAAGRFAGIQWEQFMGVKLFAWVGGFALFLAVAFFIKYSFENNWISPAIRVAMGFLTGLGLLAGGVVLKRRAYEATSQTLCATGIVILYAVSYACQAYYHFTGQTVTFGLMVAVTVTAFLLAVRLNAQVVAILGWVGGFLTPPLLATAEDHALALFGYVAILDAGLIAVALKRRWPHLALLAVGGTVFTQLGWVSRFFSIEKALIVLAVFAAFNLLFLAGALIAERREEGSPWFRGAALTPPFVTFGFALFWVADLPGLGMRPGWMLGLLLVADLPILALALQQSRLHAAQTAAGVVATVVWGSWTMWHLRPETLNWMLVGTLVLALLHTAFPAVLQRMRPGSVPAAWGHGFPVLGLGLALWPVASAVMPFTLLILAVARLPMVDPSPVYGLALLLGVLLLGLGRWLRMGAWAGVALGGVLAVEYVWYGTRFSAGAAAGPLAWAVGFTLVFVAYPFVFRRVFADRVAAWATAALAGPLVYLLVHRIIRVAYPNDVMGLVPAALGGMMLAALAVAVRTLPGEGVVRTAILSWLGGSALFFITLIVPVQFEKEWITLGWALEGMALCWLYRRLPHSGLRCVGWGLLAVAFVRLALNPAVLQYHARGTVPVWNWYLYTYGIVAACLFVGARLLVEPRGTDWSRRGAPALSAGGTILAFLLVNIEIADYFAKGPTLTFQFSGDFARDMTYSIAWSLFALLMLVVGVVRRLPAVRYAGMALLGVTVLKLFFHDLVRLSALYRIGAFLGVAVISILASVLYQRFFAASPTLEAGASSRDDQPEDR